MTTVLALAQQTQRALRGGSRPLVNRLELPLDATETSIKLGAAGAAAVTPGSILGVESELVFVWTTDPGSNTVEVMRGYGGTTALAHGAGVLIEVNERWALPDVIQAMRDEINEWPPGIYRVETRQYPVAVADQAVAVVNDWLNAYGITDARREPYGSASGYVASWPALHYARLVKDMPAGAFPGNCYVRIPELGYGGGRVSISVALPYTTDSWGPTIDLETGLGLTTGMLGLLRMGIFRRLYSFGEAALTQRQGQGESREAKEIPPGTIAGGMDTILREYTDLLRKEGLRLMGQHPIQW